MSTADTYRRRAAHWRKLLEQAETLDGYTRLAEWPESKAAMQEYIRQRERDAAEAEALSREPPNVP